MGPIGSASDERALATLLYTLLSLAALGAVALFAAFCWGVVALSHHLHWVG